MEELPGAMWGVQYLAQGLFNRCCHQDLGNQFQLVDDRSAA